MKTEERIQWARSLSVVFTGIASFFLIVNFFFMVTLLQMGSRLAILMQLVMRPQTSEQLAIADVIGSDMASFDLLNETLVRRYIKERHEIVPDIMEMENRWGKFGIFSLLSSPPVYSEFVPNLKDKLATLQGSQPSAVDIVKVERVGRNNWSVEFDIVTPAGGKNHQTSRYIATLKTLNLKERVLYTSRLNNPLGFVVTEYNLTSKKN